MYIRVCCDIKNATTSPLADTLFTNGDVFYNKKGKYVKTIKCFTQKPSQKERFLFDFCAQGVVFLLCEDVVNDYN